MDLLPGITLGRALEAANASRWRKIRGTRVRELGALGRDEPGGQPGKKMKGRSVDNTPGI